LQGDKVFTGEPLFLLHTREDAPHTYDSSTTMEMNSMFDSTEKAIGCAGSVLDEHVATLLSITEKIKQNYPHSKFYFKDKKQGAALEALSRFEAVVDIAMGGFSLASIAVLTDIIGNEMTQTTRRSFTNLQCHPLLKIAKMFQAAVKLRIIPLKGAHRLVMILKELLGFGKIYDCCDAEDEVDGYFHRVVAVSRETATYGKASHSTNKYRGRMKIMVASQSSLYKMSQRCNRWQRDMQISQILTDGLCMFQV
jgi:hypothetical protein